MKKDWTYKKLGEVAEIKAGFTPSSSELHEAGEYPYYKVSDMNTTGNEVFLISTLSYVKQSKKYFPKGSIAFPKNGAAIATNKKRILKYDSIVDLNTGVCIFDSDILPKFGYYWFQNIDFRNYTRGGALPTLDIKTISLKNIPIPPLSIQRSIVSELDLLHSVIEKKQEQLRALDNLAQSLFYQMFGDPITNPMGWQVKKLGEVGMEKLSYGSGASAIDFDKEVRYIRITDINDDGSLNNNNVSPSICEDKYLLHNGDILFARTGATVGKTYLHQKSNIKCIYAGYLIRFIPNIDIINPLYAFHFTKTQYYHDFVAQAQRAVAQPNINAQQYSNLPLPLPPLSLQQSFAAKVSAIEEQKRFISQSIKDVESLLAQRMDQYFA